MIIVLISASKLCVHFPLIDESDLFKALALLPGNRASWPVTGDTGAHRGPYSSSETVGASHDSAFSSKGDLISVSYSAHPYR